MTSIFTEINQDFQDRLNRIVAESTFMPSHQLDLKVLNWNSEDGWVSIRGTTSGPVLDSNGSGKTITLVGGKDVTVSLYCQDETIHRFVCDLWVDRAVHEVYEWHKVNGEHFTEPHPERKQGQKAEKS